MVLAVLCGCTQSPPVGEPADTQQATRGTATGPSAGREATAQRAGGAAMALPVSSTDFQSGRAIPQRFTGDGEDVSPALAWSGAPVGTAEFALICDDPDAPTPQPWVHWLIYKIPPSATGLPQGVSRAERPKDPAGALQGKNSWNAIGYRGPSPPRGHGTHHYHFRVYALKAALALAPGATKDELLTAMRGQILAEGELIGTYERN